MNYILALALAAGTVYHVRKVSSLRAAHAHVTRERDGLLTRALKRNQEEFVALIRCIPQHPQAAHRYMSREDVR